MPRKKKLKPYVSKAKPFTISFQWSDEVSKAVTRLQRQIESEERPSINRLPPSFIPGVIAPGLDVRIDGLLQCYADTLATEQRERFLRIDDVQRLLADAGYGDFIDGASVGKTPQQQQLQQQQQQLQHQDHGDACGDAGGMKSCSREREGTTTSASERLPRILVTEDVKEFKVHVVDSNPDLSDWDRKGANSEAYNITTDRLHTQRSRSSRTSVSRLQLPRLKSTNDGDSSTHSRMTTQNETYRKRLETSNRSLAVRLPTMTSSARMTSSSARNFCTASLPDDSTERKYLST